MSQKTIKFLLRTGIVLVIAIFSAMIWNFYSVERKKHSQVKTLVEEESYWTCPMHPQIHQDHPGECPICHMKLVLVKSQKEKTATENQSESRANISVTKGELNTLGIQKETVEKMSIRSLIPVSGRILSTSAIAIQIYERDLRYIKIGQAVKGADSIYSEVPIEGRITLVDTIVDPTSRTIRVVISIINGPKNLLAETGFRGNIEIELKNKIAIPENSVIHTGEGSLVYVFRNSEDLEPRIIQIGLKSEGYYEVLSGLAEGDEIASGPNFLLDSEAKIRGANDKKNH